MALRSGRILRRGLLMLSAGLFVAAATGACLPFETVRHRLDAHAGDGSADAYTPAVHHRFQLGLLLVAAAAAGLFAVVVRSQRFTPESLQRAADRMSLDCARFRLDVWRIVRESAAALIATALVAAVFRFPHLDAPLRYDEAHTVIKYAAQPAFFIVTRYDEPNNHIFHSLLVHVSTRAFGDGLVAIRLPALCAGIALALLGVLGSAALAGRTAAWMAGLVIAVWPAAIEYSVNARGYMPASMLLVVAALAGGYAVRHSNVCAALLAVTGITLCLWTIPSLLYGVVPLAVALLIETVVTADASNRRTRVSQLLTWGAVSAALTLLLWLPTILGTGLSRLILIGAGRPLPWDQFMAAVPGALAEARAFLLRDVPFAVEGWLLAGLVAAGASRSRPGRCTREGFAGLVCLLCVLAMQRALPPPRTWTILIAPLAITASAGWCSFVAGETRSRLGRGLAASVGFAGVVGLGWTAWHSDWIAARERDGTFREAAQIVDFLRTNAGPDEPVIAVTPASAPLVYYARRAGWSEIHFRVPDPSTAPESAVVVCVTAAKQTPRDVLEELRLQTLYQAGRATVIGHIRETTLYRIPRLGPATPEAPPP